MADAPPIDYAPTNVPRRHWPLRILAAATALVAMLAYFTAKTGFGDTFHFGPDCMMSVAMGELGVWLGTKHEPAAPSFDAWRLPGIRLEADHRRITTMWILRVDLYAMAIAACVLLLTLISLLCRVEKRAQTATPSQITTSD